MLLLFLFILTIIVIIIIFTFIALSEAEERDIVLNGKRELTPENDRENDTENDEGNDLDWDEDKGSVTESEYKKYVKDADVEDYLRGEEWPLW